MLMLLCVHMTKVLFLVLAGNFAPDDACLFYGTSYCVMLSVLQEGLWTSHTAQSGGHPSNCSHGNHRSCVITVVHIIFECWCVNSCCIFICIIYAFYCYFEN